jgi:protein SDA1
VKADYEECVASIARGRKGREKFGSLKDKRRKKPEENTQHLDELREGAQQADHDDHGQQGVGEKKLSSKEKQKRLRAHVERAKKAHH